MKVSVTKKHIYNGQRNNCESCPIALAIIDVTGCDSIYVYEETVYYSYVEDDGRRRGFTYNLSKSAKRFVSDFDDGKDVKPVVFKLSEKKCL